MTSFTNIEELLQRIVGTNRGKLIVCNALASVRLKLISGSVARSYMEECRLLEKSLSVDNLVFEMNEIAQRGPWKWASPAFPHPSEVSTTMEFETFTTYFVDEPTRGANPLLNGDPLSAKTRAIAAFNREPEYKAEAAFGGNHEEQFWVTNELGNSVLADEGRDLLGLQDVAGRLATLVQARIQSRALTDCKWFRPTYVDAVTQERFRIRRDGIPKDNTWGCTVSLKKLRDRDTQLDGVNERVVSKCKISGSENQIEWLCAGNTTPTYHSSYTKEEELKRLSDLCMTQEGTSNLVAELLAEL